MYVYLNAYKYTCMRTALAAVYCWEAFVRGASVRGRLLSGLLLTGGCDRGAFARTPSPLRVSYNQLARSQGGQRGQICYLCNKLSDSSVLTNTESLRC
jgi:hypothetical protein